MNAFKRPVSKRPATPTGAARKAAAKAAGAVRFKGAPGMPSTSAERAPYVHGPAPVLTPAQRQKLKGQAHDQQPVVMIGHKGLTDALIGEIDVQLNKHGLIKIKAATDERDEREAWLLQVCEKLNAAPVQHIGKILLIFRPKPPEPDAEPAPKKVRPSDKPTPQERRMAAAGISPNVARARIGSGDAGGGKAPGFKTSDRRAGTARTGGAYGANTRKAQEYKQAALDRNRDGDRDEVDATTLPPRARPRPPQGTRAPRAGGFQSAGARTRRRNTG